MSETYAGGGDGKWREGHEKRGTGASSEERQTHARKSATKPRSLLCSGERMAGLECYVVFATIALLAFYCGITGQTEFIISIINSVKMVDMSLYIIIMIEPPGPLGCKTTTDPTTLDRRLIIV